MGEIELITIGSKNRIKSFICVNTRGSYAAGVWSTVKNEEEVNPLETE